MKRILLLLALFCSSLFATEYAPWFSPLWEFQSRVGYLFNHTSRVESPRGSFNRRDNFQEFSGALAMTVWPEIQVEGELILVQSNTLGFAYEAFLLTARKLWLDDLCGDWISLATGITFAFPPRSILHNFDFAYHGYLNGEVHLALGKEFRNHSTCAWHSRLWGLIGYGVAERGSPWLQGRLHLDHALSECVQATLFVHSLFGFGGNDIIPNEPFFGYASIHHQAINLGGKLRYKLGYLGSITLLGYINIYAHNFIEHTLGCGAIVHIPFGL